MNEQGRADAFDAANIDPAVHFFKNSLCGLGCMFPISAKRSQRLHLLALSQKASAVQVQEARERRPAVDWNQ